MFATLLELLKGLLQAIPILAKYFPAKTAEQKTQEGQAAIDKKIGDIENTGRPQ